MSKYTDEHLDNMFYTLEKSIKQVGRDLTEVMLKLDKASYKSVGKSGKVTISKKTAKDGDIVGVFKLESENPFESN